MIKEVIPEIVPPFKVPYTLYRYDKGDNRYYYRFEGEPSDDSRREYLSVTSFCGMSLGLSPTLKDWAAKYGTAHAELYTTTAAEYGTLMHITIVNCLRAKKSSFEAIADEGFTTAIQLGFKFLAEEWMDKLVRDVFAFFCFLKQRNVKIVFAELPVYSDTYKVAGCIDLGVEMDFGRGRINALVDLKSGRKGFYDSHILQLGVYKKIFNDLFDWKVSHVFNWAPKDWKIKNGQAPKDWNIYKLQNQTDRPLSYGQNAPNVEARLQVGVDEGWCQPFQGHTDIRGEFTHDFNPDDHVQYTTFDGGSEDFI